MTTAPDPAESLDDYMGRDAYASEGWRVTNDEEAVWALRKLTRIRRRKEANLALAESEASRAYEWAASENSKMEHDEAFFEGVLSEYARRERANNDRKTIGLPVGTIQTSARKGRPAVADATAVTEWARSAHPEWVSETVVRKVPAATVSTAFTNGEIAYVGGALRDDTGHEIPGLTWKAPEVTVKITPTQPENEDTE